MSVNVASLPCKCNSCERQDARRQRLLDQIFVAEEQLAPMSTELFTRSRRPARAP